MENLSLLVCVAGARPRTVIFQRRIYESGRGGIAALLQTAFE